MLELEIGLQDGKVGGACQGREGARQGFEAGRGGCLDGVTKSSDCFTHSEIRQASLPLVLLLASQLVALQASVFSAINGSQAGLSEIEAGDSAAVTWRLGQRCFTQDGEVDARGES